MSIYHAPGDSRFQRVVSTVVGTGLDVLDTAYAVGRFARDFWQAVRAGTSTSHYTGPVRADGYRACPGCNPDND